MNDTYQKMRKNDRMKLALHFLEQDAKYQQFANDCLDALQSKFKVGDLVLSKAGSEDYNFESRITPFVITELVLPNKVIVEPTAIRCYMKSRPKKYDEYDKCVEYCIDNYLESLCYLKVEDLVLINEVYVIESKEFFENGKPKKQMYMHFYYGSNIESFKNVVRYKRLPLTLINKW